MVDSKQVKEVWRKYIEELLNKENVWNSSLSVHGVLFLSVAASIIEWQCS